MASSMDLKTSRPSSFFTVLLGDFQEKLLLPRAFVRAFNGEEPKNFILRSDTGISWTVSVKKLDNNFFLCNEWQIFAKENALQLGEFLVFECNSISDFTVQIFGTNECAKEVSLAKKFNAQVKTVKETASVHPEIRRECSDETSGEAVVTGRMISFPDKHNGSSVKKVKSGSLRSFTMTFGPSSVGKLILPRPFSRKYLRGPAQDVTLRVPNSGMWLTRCTVGAHHVLTTGWKIFCADNNLKEGDVCTFKLEHRKNMELKVSIVRSRA